LAIASFDFYLIFIVPSYPHGFKSLTTINKLIAVVGAIAIYGQ